MDYTGGALDTPVDVLIFGDSSNPYDAELNLLLQVHDCDVLSSFFEHVHYALRFEISRLPIAQQEMFPRFTCLSDVLASTCKSGSNPALELFLLSLTQLGRFIKYYGQGSRPFPSSSSTTVLGICTGSLAAAAVSTSSTIFELIPVAVEAVLIAFRTGLRSMEVRDTLERGSGLAPPAWSVIVGMEEAHALAELNAFSGAKGYSPTARPYLSCVTPTTVTVSGPPKALDALRQTKAFESLKPVWIPVHAPYHAVHLYSLSDVDDIVKASNKAILTSYSVKMPFVSCSTGTLSTASNFESLIRLALQDILVEQLRWDNVLKQCGTTFSKLDILSPCRIDPIITSTSSSHSLCSSLRQELNIDARVANSIMGSDSNAGIAQSRSKTARSKIAIIGYSGRFPDAESNQKFWDLLHAGLDVHREIPADRFDMKAHFDPSGKRKNTSKVQYGCWIKDPGLFDARFFNMSPREAANADPGQRLAITTAYEALEMAGFVPDRTPSSQRDRVGIFYGMTSDDWREVNSGQNVDTYFIPGGNRAFTPGRINYHFKFSGPSFSVDTACSSSFAAIHTACNSLWRGDCDTAIAGGTNVMTNPDNFAGLDRGHFLSNNGNCNTFDDEASGYCRADAVGTIILKRLEDAEADHDPIFGVLLGAYTNHSAEAESMTRPHVGAQAFIFDKMLRTANVSPLNISYIEMHGTGTQAGDATEMRSVLDVFTKEPRGPQHPLYLGSAKANVGHAESASGVTSLIKVLLMMENDEIPPHVGIKTRINHNFPTDLKARNVNIALEPAPWTRPENGKRTVFMNNFSAAGGNTALLMEDGPASRPSDVRDCRTCLPVAVSAKSVLSLQRNLEAMANYIDNAPDLSLSALSYTTTARRTHHSFRTIVVGGDVQTVKRALKELASCTDIRKIAAQSPKVGFVFTGQGSAYAGMAQQLFESISSFQSDIRRFDAIARNQGFPPFLPMVEDRGVDFSALSPVVTQVGAACVQMALTRLWISWGITPSIVVGHSLGEYAALHAAGVLTASDVIYLTGTRAQMLEEQCSAGTHAMLAVKASLSAVTARLAGTSCEIACINGPNEIVVSGDIIDIDALANTLTALNFKCVKLEVPYAFHSAQVEPILKDFDAAAQSTYFGQPAIPFISPLLERVVGRSETLNPSYLSEACRKPVNFLGGIEAAKAAALVDEKTVWIEIGAHPVCSGMLKSIISPRISAIPSLRRYTDTWETIAESIASLHRIGLELNWNEYHRDFESFHRVLKLPSYNWDSKNHWIQYENNFCLTKGDSIVVSSAPKPQISSLSTTAVQRVVGQTIGKDCSTVLVESDLSDPILARVLQGHQVNGAPLCPSSLYADVALTVGDYLLEISDKKSEDRSMAVSDMVVEKPLIASGDGAQMFRASATASWSSWQVKLHIFSATPDGKKLADHAHCTVQYASKAQWLSDWKRNAYLIHSRIDALNKGVDDGQTHKIKRGMAYKLFGAVVQYGSSYQGMQEVVLDSAQLEAAAKVEFQTTQKDGDFYLSPYWIDSLGHLAGFILNGNDEVDSGNTVYVNHGWDSMRCATRFSQEKKYRTYNRMQNIGGTMFAGDTYIFDDEDVVAIFHGVKFQAVPRRVLDHLLPTTRSSPPASKRDLCATKSKVETTIRTEKTHVQTGMTQPPLLQKVVAHSETLEVITNTPTTVARALLVIAEEIGVSASDLTPNMEFADVGVDSLLSLTIGSRLREELDLDVPSSLFADYPTVRDLTAFLGFGDDVGASTQTSTTAPTPDTASESNGDQTEMTTVTTAHSDDINVMATIQYILAEEVGIPVEDFKSSTDFVELGMDSLLSLTILARLREELNIDLSPTLFADNHCLDDVELALGLNAMPISTTIQTIKKGPVISVREVAQEPLVALQAVLPTVEICISESARPPIPKATSMVLQGNPKTATKALFLLPDGSGSATSYAPLPPISPSVVVYGLNCPYMRSPQDMKCSIEDLTPPYLTEICRRQPRGPYYLGGWSAGGICAFDAAQELQRRGETVERLLLIDSPFPIGLEKLPPRLYDFFASIGMFGSSADGKAPPAWLVPHFLAFVDALDRYRARPFPPGRLNPKTHIIWAKDGVCKHPEDPRPEPRADDPREMKWLLENRTDFGPNGWDALIGRDDVVIEVLEDANHFSLMQGEKVKELARFVERALA